MKLFYALALTLALLTPRAWAGGDAPISGAELYANHCTRCHGSEVYNRPQRLVNSYAELRERVRQCELTAELTWFDEEVEAVVGYLDETFYKFSEMRE